MKKSQIGTIFILVITVGLIGAIIYFSILLSDNSSTSVTQIKKTKASAVTYHKLLALNETPIPGNSSSSTSDSGGVSSSSTATEGNSSSEPTPTESIPEFNSSSAVSSLSQQVSSDVNGSGQSSSEVVAPSPTIQPTAVAVPTAGPTLLVYRTITITPTLIPSRNTGATLPEVSSSSLSSSKSSVMSAAPSRTPTVASKQLPETGWVQLSTILFIVAVTTVFVSFLF